MDDLEHWIRLAAIPSMDRLKHQQWSTQVSADDFHQLDDHQLQQLGFTSGQIQCHRAITPRRIEHCMEWLQTSPDHHFIRYTDPLYPELLCQIKQPPFALFIKGDLALLNEAQIAIVGSRQPTATGKQVAFNFAADLCRLGLTVTSGMAKGIDGCSHRGALSVQGNTIAVLGHGFDTVYPAQHKELATDIANSGALVSEFLPDVPPKGDHFPLRNRIVVGLSLGTLVVEAALKSGSLISAGYAAEYSRELFVIPGSIYNPQAAGCHQLIQQGAKLTTCVADIIEEWSFLQNNGLSTVKGKEKNLQTGLFDDGLLANVGDEATAIDVIAERSGLSVAQVSIELLQLELAGEVAAVPGGYIRVRRA